MPNHIRRITRWLAAPLALFIVRRAEEAEKRAAAAEAENRLMRQLLQGRAA